MGRAANINPKILPWARETAGLSLEEAAHKIGLTATEKKSAAEKLYALEQGEHAPTRTQILRMASVYRRPLIVFYMRNRPREGDRGEDFRTLPGMVSERDNGLLDALLRDVRARQQMVRSLLEDEEETEPLPFVRGSRISDGVGNVATSIRDHLEVDPESQKSAGTADELFLQLRAAAERIGIFVLLAGDLGSHHTTIDETVFRGFAIADAVAPFIIINDQDARSARSFTLLHELAHLWLGASGVSGSFVIESRGASKSRIERFCNDVASEFLLPSSEIADMSPLRSADESHILEVTDVVAGRWNVSQAMVAYRIFREGWIAEDTWRSLARHFAERWRSEKQRRRAQARMRDGGPSYYVLRRYKLGTALIDVVRRTLRENALTHTKAAKLLGVRPSSVEPLLRSRSGATG